MNNIEQVTTGTLLILYIGLQVIPVLSIASRGCDIDGVRIQYLEKQRCIIVQCHAGFECSVARIWLYWYTLAKHANRRHLNK